MAMGTEYFEEGSLESDSKDFGWFSTIRWKATSEKASGSIDGALFFAWNSAKRRLANDC